MISTSLLSRRLKELEHLGIVQIRPIEGGRGNEYHLPATVSADVVGYLRLLGGAAHRRAPKATNRSDDGRSTVLESHHREVRINS